MYLWGDMNWISETQVATRGVDNEENVITLPTKVAEAVAELCPRGPRSERVCDSDSRKSSRASRTFENNSSTFSAFSGFKMSSPIIHAHLVPMIMLAGSFDKINCRHYPASKPWYRGGM
jgi:hypothetical protein